MGYKKGKFIVIEGLDGSGQTTQIALLEKYLKEKGHKVHLTFEPSQNIIGGLIKGLLTNQWKLSNTGMQLLFCVDRAHHLESEVMPAIEQGNIVISSRYYFSTMAYGALDNDLDWLMKLNEKFPQPDLAFFLKVSPKECIRRITNSRFRQEFFEKVKKLEKVLKNYLKIFGSGKFQNVFVIDGEQSITEVAGQIAKIADKIIK